MFWRAFPFVVQSGRRSPQYAKCIVATALPELRLSFDVRCIPRLYYLRPPQ